MPKISNTPILFLDTAHRNDAQDTRVEVGNSFYYFGLEVEVLGILPVNDGSEYLNVIGFNVNTDKGTFFFPRFVVRAEFYPVESEG